jgi:SsrA-binding protein
VDGFHGKWIDYRSRTTRIIASIYPVVSIVIIHMAKTSSPVAPTTKPKPQAGKVKDAKPVQTRIADNKKAAYNYFFEDRFECGMVLEGWEVKSLREGKVQLTDGYVVIRNNELFLIGCQINPMHTASTHVNPDNIRTKKLLLHREQIDKLIVKAEQKGYTLVPLNLHWKGGKVKCEIALAKGKAEHDKRDTIKDREGKREVERAMKTRNK